MRETYHNMPRGSKQTPLAQSAGPGVRPAPRSNKHRPRSLRIVITAGPTREYLDSVRFISNASSGKMGYAIATAAAAAGHHVTLITGPVETQPPRGVRTIRVETAAEMLRATLKAFTRADAAVFAAAVCDYRPCHRSARKLPKKRAAHTLELIPTEDIAAACGLVKGRRVTIAFALEDHDGRRHAKAKLLQKKADAIVLNGPDTVGSDNATTEFLAAGGRWQRWGSTSKARLATKLVRLLETTLVAITTAR